MKGVWGGIYAFGRYVLLKFRLKKLGSLLLVIFFLTDGERDTVLSISLLRDALVSLDQTFVIRHNY